MMFVMMLGMFVILWFLMLSVILLFLGIVVNDSVVMVFVVVFGMLVVGMGFVF